jgi:PPOX class probable F420-dependent enzyme
MPPRPNSIDATSPERLWQIISATKRGILATIGNDGVPHLTNMHFLADPSGTFVRMSTQTDRLKGKNLQRDPRATLHVQGDDWFNYAVATGTITLYIAKEVGDAATDELFEVHQGLGAVSTREGFDEQMLANHRMVVRLDITRLYGQVREVVPTAGG